VNTVPAKLTPKLEQEMQVLVKEGWYASKSEVIRDAVRGLVRKLKAERMAEAIKEDAKWGLK